jgi:hypothetical protein
MLGELACRAAPSTSPKNTASTTEVSTTIPSYRQRSSSEANRGREFSGACLPRLTQSLNWTGRARAPERINPSSTATRIASDLLLMPRARMNFLSVCSNAGVMWMLS